MPQQTIRHHFVPQFILRNFTDESGFLQVFDRKNPQKGVWGARPQNIFVRRHLYSFLREDGSKDTSLEDEFSKIEGRAAEVVDKILSSARSWTPLALSDADFDAWIEFWILQWRRVPAMRARLSGDFDEILNRSIDEIEVEGRPVTMPERDWIFSPDGKERLMHNSHIEALKFDFTKAKSILKNRGLLIAVAPKSKSFIISDEPVVKLNHPGRSQLSDTSTELLFPIAHDVLVTPGAAARKCELIEIKDINLIRSTNLTQARNGNSFVGRSPELVLSLSRHFGAK